MRLSVTRYIPLVLMVWGIAFSAFIYGFLLGHLRLPSFSRFEDARLALVISWGKVLDPNRIRELGAWTDISPDDIQKSRIVAHEPVEDESALMLTGGEAQFLEYCPENGCAAVILGRDGKLIHAYPFRPEELSSRRTVDLPYGEILHDDSKDTAVFGLAPLSNGDLIVVYDFEGTSPLGGGIARMDKEGHLVWYRRDYTDHWPTITSEGEILSISHDIGSERIRMQLAKDTTYSFGCPNGVSRDIVRVLDFAGRVKEEIPIFDALIASPYRTRLRVDIDPLIEGPESCYPVHTNSVVPVGQELAAKFNNVQPGDLLLSLRNISALVIIGRSDHAVKQLITGSFIQQHSAQVLPGGNIVMFDNFGSSPAGGPSRVLIYDPVTRQEETLFPNKHTPKGTEIFSSIFGNIDISDDGARAIFTVGRAGKAYEIALADGKLLTTFNNLHDVSRLAQFADSPRKVRYFTEFGVYYVPPHIAD
jgi:hypothetical protein